jgi:hypothetical protein
MAQPVIGNQYIIDFRGLLMKYMNLNIVGWKTLKYINNFYNITLVENAERVNYCLRKIDNHPFRNLINNLRDKNKKESQIPFIIELRNFVKKYKHLDIGGMKTLIDIVTCYDSMTPDNIIILNQCMEGLDNYSLNIYNNSADINIALHGNTVYKI